MRENNIVNMNEKTGIRYGVISVQKVDLFYEDAEGRWSCDDCQYAIDDEEEYNPECDYCESTSYLIDTKTLAAEQSADSPDIFVYKSAFYALCALCSPCAPNAGDLASKGDYKTYCFDHGWYEGDKAPYKVYSVETGKEI